MSLLAGLEAYWGFEEGAGTTAADATGSGRTLSFTGAVGWVPGAIKTGIRVDGASTIYAQNTSTFSGITNDFTIAGYIAWPLSGIKRAINIGTTGNGPCFWCNGTTFGLVHFGTNDVTWTGALTSTALLHYAVTRSGNNFEFYISGVSQGIQTSSVSYTFNGITLGRDPAIGDIYTGVLDEIAIWSRALTAPEVAQLCNNGQGLPYPFGIRRVGKPLGTSTVRPQFRLVPNNVGTLINNAIFTGAGGSTFNVSVAETGTLADADSAIATMGVTVAETGTLLDAPTPAVNFLVTVTETGSATDSESANTNGTFNDSVAESGSVADAVSASVQFSVTVNEAGTLADAESAVATYVAQLLESGTALDSFPVTAILNVGVTETAFASDSVKIPGQKKSTHFKKFFSDIGTFRRH